MERWIEHFHEILTTNSVIQKKEELIYQRPIITLNPQLETKCGKLDGFK
jgi:hypothetical protein